MAHVTGLGEAPTLLDLYRRYPALAKPLLALAHAAFTLTAELSRAECELVGAYVSQLNGCGYCRGVHGAAAIACGIARPALPAPDASSRPVRTRGAAGNAVPERGRSCRAVISTMSG